MDRPFHLRDYDITITEVHRNLPPSELSEHAIHYDKGAHLAENGALVAYSGVKTGRSPKDKRVVKHPDSEADVWWGAATFLGGLAVGAASAGMARSRRTPVAVIAFSGAVTMIPGLSLYRALAGALELARLRAEADPGLAARVLGHASHGTLLVVALALGLTLGARAVLVLAGERDRRGPPRAGPESHATRPGASEPVDRLNPATRPAEPAFPHPGGGLSC